eukprot:GEMP01012799.1.p1 GENE.GEMP01012799.1~~GEMP01012799.1.p1  ORF type:complete len:676 (+),score=136.93 GEMP01012799.1:420-2447(+)
MRAHSTQQTQLRKSTAAKNLSIDVEASERLNPSEAQFRRQSDATSEALYGSSADAPHSTTTADTFHSVSTGPPSTTTGDSRLSTADSRLSTRSAHTPLSTTHHISPDGNVSNAEQNASSAYDTVQHTPIPKNHGSEPASAPDSSKLLGMDSVSAAQPVGGSLLFRCKVCGLEHNSKEAALQHSREDHGKRNPEPTRSVRRSTLLRCQVCGQGSPTRDDFLNHMVEVHNATPKSYNNDKVYCPELSPSHYNNPQEETVVIRKCPECHLEVANVEELIEHLQVAHQKQEAVVFRCSECNIALPSKAAVLEHMSKDHQRVIEQQTRTPELLSCPICKHKVASREDMTVHLRTHDEYVELEDNEHQELPTDSTENPEARAPEPGRSVAFRCSICELQLATRELVLEHMQDEHPQMPDVSTAENPGGSIVRQTNPGAGISRTVVKDKGGQEVAIFDDQIIHFLMQDEDGGKDSKDYIKGLNLLCFRGLLTELGHKLIKDSKAYHAKKKEENALVLRRAFAFFELDDNSTKKDAHDAYRRAARSMHPDKNKGCEKAKNKFQQMKEMYEAVKLMFPGESLDDDKLYDDDEKASADVRKKESREAYDEDSPIPKSVNPAATIQYNPECRESMKEALGRMIQELRRIRQDGRARSGDDSTPGRIGLRRKRQLSYYFKFFIYILS